MEFGDKIRRLRLEKGLTQTELADKLGMCFRSICGYEIGDRVPRPATLAKLADFFNVSVSYLSDPDCTDRNEGIERDPYVTEARNRYGNSGAMDLDGLLQANQAAFAGGELSDKQKDKFFQAITEMYFACKEESSKKFGRKKK